MFEISSITIIALITMCLRFLPFWVFNNKTPEIVMYYGKVLPYAMMGMLVVYCLRNTTLIAMPFGLPEIIASSTVIGLHILKRNTLLSIATGTVVYMFLIQLVF